MLGKRTFHTFMEPSSFKGKDLTEYTEIEKVGSGAFGEVSKGFIKKDPTKFVAQKKIKSDKTDNVCPVTGIRRNQGFPITAIREIVNQKKLSHPNIVKLFDVVKSNPEPTNADSENTIRSKRSVFMVFEYMEHDLSGLLRRRLQVDISQIKCLMSQLLKGMIYLEEMKIYHRDLKPANLLQNNHGELKIADFGLSRELKPKLKNLTVKIATPTYRAPELMLGDKNYDYKVDVWSGGCILAELQLGEPFFRGVKNDHHLMDLIFQRLGTPNDEEWPTMKSLPNYKAFEPRKQYTCMLRDYFFKRKPNVDRSTLNLLENMLKLNPKQRYSSKDALNHEFFKTEPLPCDKSKLPKIENECHEFQVVEELNKRKQQLMNNNPENNARNNQFNNNVNRKPMNNNPNANRNFNNNNNNNNMQRQHNYQPNQRINNPGSNFQPSYMQYNNNLRGNTRPGGQFNINNRFTQNAPPHQLQSFIGRPPNMFGNGNLGIGGNQNAGFNRNDLNNFNRNP